MTAPDAQRPPRGGSTTNAAGAVTRASLGAWLLKCNPSVTDADALIRDGTVTSWCVARNYRSGLMTSGDPVVFWISGNGRRTPVPGVWGLGRLTGQVVDATKPSVPMLVQLVADPVPREELRAMPEFATLEVLRQPMGSNPSWLDKAQWLALRRLLVDNGDLAQA